MSGERHEHDHSHHLHPAHPAHPSQSRIVLIRAIVITLVFMAIELLGGFFSNSLALITDALHMGADVAALAFSLFAIWFAARPKTARMSFGYHRAEILGALASGLGIWLLSGILIYEAIIRLRNPPEVLGGTVFIIASIGLLANLASMRMLHGSSHENMNVRAAYLHVLSDAIGSVGAVVAGLIIWWTGWRPIDPIITLGAAALMLYSSWELITEAVSVLMESTPSGLDPEQVRTDLERLSGVQEVHDLHIWSVAKGKLALSVHVIARDPEESVLASSNKLLQDNYGIVHTTIQVEHPDRFSSERCYDCAT